MYGLLMTLALTFFLSTEMEELFTLRKKVKTLERDYENVKGKHERLGWRLVALYEDANNGQPFVPPKFAKGELVSTSV